ncbi:MAG: rhomboid family intramembrane serine protease [Bacteroidota bacterium]
MWLFFTVEYYLGIDLGFLGIYPRETSGLLGVLFAPMIHGDFNHLLSNSIPLLVLGGSLYFFYPSIARKVFLQGYFFTNLLVWILARPSYHIGASGLVYALASFLAFYGLFRKNFKSVVISVIVILFYGGLIHGLFAFNANISWESHLMGAIVGFTSAYIFRKSK